MESTTLPLGYGEEHHGPPEANRSSRVDQHVLGMLLFVVSEIMLFGAFFTAYFFVRVISAGEWFPIDGVELPWIVAAVNTAVLVSSSFTMHWALEAVRHENRPAMAASMLTTFLLGLTFLIVQVNEYVHLGAAPADHAQATIFYGLTGLHGAHVFVGLCLLAFVTVRVFRGHFSREEHRGLEVPGIYWHFVDVMWIIVFSSVYLL
ncbi:MAG: cytochrome c oxidase subunit 3 [Actinomycetota bacterium]|nr:cytochrome c oxidase subunit 3 [Actinomycetota bacterium]